MLRLARSSPIAAWTYHRSRGYEYANALPSPSTRLAGGDIHADDAVFRGDPLLGGASKTIEALLYDDIAEAEVPEQRDKLCLRQSAGNSTGPQIDVAANRFRQLGCDDNVSIQELSSWLENPEDLAEGPIFIRRQIQHAIRDHDIDALRFDGQRHRVSETHVDVGKPT
jgi:hypothetical protein